MSSKKGDIINLINPHGASILPSGLPNANGKTQRETLMLVSPENLDYYVGEDNTPFTVLRATSLEEVREYYRIQYPNMLDEIVDEVARQSWLILEENKNKLSDAMV